MLYRVVAFLLRTGFATLYRWRVKGLERLPKKGGCVVVANHRNFADALVVGAALPRATRFMAKAEIFTWPIVGQFVRRVYAFPVRRGVGDRRAINAALAVVRQGQVLGLFPEGTRHHDGKLHELRGGAALVHLATGAPIIPVGLLGTERLKLFRFPRVAVYVGAPLTLPPIDGLPERAAIATINQAIREGLERCLAEAQLLMERRRVRVG